MLYRRAMRLGFVMLVVICAMAGVAGGQEAKPRAGAELVGTRAIAHIAGHKRVDTTTKYVHSNREQTRAVLNARPGIPVTDLELADLNHVTDVLTVGNHNASEDGGIGRRAGFRLQRPISIAALSLRDIPHRLRPEEVSEGHQYAHFGHGDRNEGGVVPMDDVHRAAAALLHWAADGGGIPLEIVRAFAELVLRSELGAGSRQVLDGPPELASVVLAVGARVDVDEDGRSSK